MLSSVFYLFLVFFIFQLYDLLHSIYYYIYHFLSCTYVMSPFMEWLHAHAMLFISYILLYHIFSYTILYCHILYICVFTLTIELTFTTDSRGNFVMFVIPYIFILYFSYTILSYNFYIVCFSYTVLSYYLSYTFRVIETLFLVLVYLSYTFLFHILYLFIYFSCIVLCTFHILSYIVLCPFYILSCTVYFS